MKKQLLTMLVAAVLFVSSGVSAQGVQVDAKLENYAPVSGISGNINSVGSDTLNNLMTLWAESFKARYPNVKIQIEGKGSSTAPPALIEGTAQFGPMSRQMKPTEIDAFEKKYGYKPIEIKVAIDSLAVYVHKDNPMKGLTLAQVDGLFSGTFKRGGKNATKWGQVGLTGEWANRPISLYGRNSASGTYGYFKEIALNKGDFKPTVKEQPGSSSVVQGVASDLNGIGYSGIGYKTSGVKAIALGTAAGKLVDPSYQNALNGSYPLARFLYIYINKKPGQPVNKLVGEFVRFVQSKQGQEIVVKDGYFPLPTKVVADDLAKLR